MASGFETLGASRPAAAPAPARGHVADHSAARTGYDQRCPGWLVLVPLSSIVVIGFLVIALSWMVGGPGRAPAPSPARADVGVEINVPVIDETEVGETMVRVEPGFMR